MPQQEVSIDELEVVTLAAHLSESLAHKVGKEVEDSEMRHGRKSRSLRFDGYKRHVVYELDLELIRAVGLTAANQPEASVSDEIRADLLGQAVQLTELHIDWGYLSSKLVRSRPPELTVYCEVCCPTIRCKRHSRRGRVQFSAEVCGACPLRAQCTSSERGRSVSIHPDERLLVELRERQLRSRGRAELRQRVAVEHRLAHVGQWQGLPRLVHRQAKEPGGLAAGSSGHNLHVLMRQAGSGPAA